MGKKKQLGPDPMTWGRVLHLVRHGQYTHEPGFFGGTLTPLGRKQARRAGKHLSAWKIHAIHSSDYCRASETADLIASELGINEVKRHRILREVQPTAIPGWKVPLAKRAEGRDAMGQVVKRFFKNSRTPRHEIIVCHGNLIRYLSCQMLGAPATAWMKLGTYHCGVTHVVIVKGRTIMLSYNSIGHLPLSLQTCR